MTLSHRVLLFLVCFFLLSSQVVVGAEPLKMVRIAIIPCSDPLKMYEHFQPLIHYLEKETGMKFELKVPMYCGALKRMVIEKEVEFAYQSAHDYIQLVDYYNKDTLLKALTVDGNDHLYGLLIVRKDSDIRQLQDLRGKVVQFGPARSLQKWIAARWLFEEKGIDIEKDLAHYVKGGCCEDIAFNVFVKAVDAGIICDHALDEIRKEDNVDVSQLRELGRTKLVPTHVLAARKDVPSEVVTAVNSALLKLDSDNPQHAKMLQFTEIGGFQRSSDDQYDGLRKISAEAGSNSCN